MPDLTGQSLGRYHILEQLGEGGMATVYKAYDTRLEREVALKVLRTDQFIPAQLQMVLQRFEREAKSLAKLKHPNIVNILDFGEHEGMPYLVMEYLPGGTLKQKLGEKISWQAAIQSLIPVARGLAYAHQHGIIHRDVKPANILIDENNEPVLTDFGIAKLLETSAGQTLTASGVGIGTPEYMAPEQGLGAKSIDARADIYALGIVLYEMVVGRKPYTADTPMAIVLKQISDPLPRPADFAPDLPEGVENILFKALAKQPDDRYQDMTALIAAMESLLLEMPTVPLRVVTAPPQESVAAAPPTVEQAPDEETDEKAPAAPESAPTRLAEKKPAPRLRLSPKAILAVLGVVAIVVLAVFGLPRLIRQIPAAPVVKVTSTTQLTAVPTAIVTSLPPSATPEPSLTLTKSNTQLPSKITDAKGVSMRLVPAGEFTMGASAEAAVARCEKYPSGETCSLNNLKNVEPRHIVYLDAYYMDTFEVTNALYQTCVEAGVCKPPYKKDSATLTDYYGNTDFDKYPVINIDWNMAKTYCEWRGARLPTEAEWEKAARGTDERTFPWGEGPELAPPALSGTAAYDTTQIGLHENDVSPFGVSDMAGNVSEWVADWYDKNYYNNSPANNPPGPANGQFHVVRGGSITGWGFDLSTIKRRVGSQTGWINYIGFRCASNAELVPTVQSAPQMTASPTAKPAGASSSGPAWVTDFAEPILAEISAREPDIQDTFDWNTTFWAPSEWCASRTSVANGVMKFKDCHIEWTRNFENYVASLDLRLVGNEQFNFYLRRSESFGGCQFGFQQNSIFWQCNYPDPKNQVKYLAENITFRKILVIVKGNQFGLYVNDKPVEMIQVEVLKHGAISYLGGSAEIDNFKLWNIK